jgi:hypothetical protein
MRLKNVCEVQDEFGNIQVLSKTFATKVKSDSFYMVFNDFMLMHISGKLTEAERSITDYLCSIAEFDTGVVYVTKNRKKEILEKYQLSKNHYYICIRNLIAKKIIEKKNDDEFIINPLLFWKGNIDTRNELLKANKNELTIKFSISEKE